MLLDNAVLDRAGEQILDRAGRVIILRVLQALVFAAINREDPLGVSIDNLDVLGVSINREDNVLGIEIGFVQ